MTVTWLFLGLWLAAMTEGWLVPWDSAPGRPPIGISARTINDFFEGTPGAILPCTLFVLASASIFALRLTRSDRRTQLPLFFAVSNLILVVVATLVAIFAHQLPDLWLSQPRPTPDLGFHQTWPAIVMTSILLTSLLVAQCKWRLPAGLERPKRFTPRSTA